MAFFTEGHALLIGIGSYQHAGYLNVPVTVRDAQAVGAVLRDPHLCDYPERQITLLHDAKATREGIISALDGLAARATESDTLLLFYGGHGDYADDGTYYLTTHDTRVVDHKAVSGTGVSQQELLEKLRNLKAKRVLLIFNACHAGEVSPTLGADDLPIGHSLPEQTVAALLATGEGRIIITACRENQYSFIGRGELTIFGQALADGLRGKGTSSRHGYISAFDLYTHLYFAVREAVTQQVPEELRQRYGEEQEPELTVLKGVGPFAVALYRGATVKGTFAAPGHPAEGTAFRAVDPRYSRAMLQQLMQIHGDVVDGDKIDATGSQGMINRPTGPVYQGFDSQRNIHMPSGIYVEGKFDNRRGMVVGGVQATKAAAAPDKYGASHQAEPDAASTTVDLTVVTALQEELEPVLNLIGGREHWTSFTLDNFIHYRGQFTCGPRPLNVVAGSLWKFGGNTTTAQIIRLKQLRPRLIVMTGICAGWQDRDIHLGDVIVADRAFHGGEGKLTTAGFRPDIWTYQPPQWLLQWLKDFAHDRQWVNSISTPRPHSLRYHADWLLCQLATRGPGFPSTNDDWQHIQSNNIDYPRARQRLLDTQLISSTGQLTTQAEKRLAELRQQQYGQLIPIPDPAQPAVHYKAFASSEAVVAVPDPFTNLATSVRGIGALEMEVAALLSAALEIGVPAFAVKGVSDYGTPEKDDAFHAYAAEASARWMYAFVCRYGHLAANHTTQ
jgi:nucleoside phosphorylase